MNMRINCLRRTPAARRPYRRQGAFTLVEIMVTAMIALVIVAALMSSYMYGMRMFEVVKPKLATSDQARHTISKIVTEVRSAGSIQIGTGSETRFTPASPNAVKSAVTRGSVLDRSARKLLRDRGRDAPRRHCLQR